MKSKSGHYFVTPDNGTLTLVTESLGIESIRQIDEELNRRKNSFGSYTFHGRDVYSYTAARLAANIIKFEKVGALLPAKVLRIDYQQPLIDGDSIVGNIPILDVQYGNVWTNISDTLCRKLNIKAGDSITVIIRKAGTEVYQGRMPFVRTFGEVPEKHPLGYLNSLMNLAVALNMSSFSDSFRVKSGPEWKIVVKSNKMGN
jgi:S-adenosylmethionine hydrolase